MNEVLQVAKMVSSLEQCAFIVKWYHETHSLKCVPTDLIQEFLNSICQSNLTILNLLTKIEYEHTLDNLPHLGQPSVVT